MNPNEWKSCDTCPECEKCRGELEEDGGKKMNKIDWVRKLTSRKLWLAVAAFVSGLIVAFGGEKNTAETVAGCILQGAAVLGYVLAEGLRDAAEAGAEERGTDDGT